MIEKLYQVLYNNVLLPRRREIDREEEREAFNGTTESLVQLYRENQITSGFNDTMMNFEEKMLF